MFKQRIFIVSVILFVVLSVMHYLGLKFDIYFKFKEFDIPMHIIGGLFISLFIFWILPFLQKDYSIKNYRVRSIWIGLVSVLILAVLWEVIELLRGQTSIEDKVFVKDTIGDFVFAFVGLIIGLTYCFNQKKCANGVCELVRPTSLSIDNLNNK